MVAWILGAAAASACGSGGDTASGRGAVGGTTSAATGAGGSGADGSGSVTGTGGSGGAGGEGGSGVCNPGDEMPCYTGPAGTENIGLCIAGVSTCNAEGTGYGACVGDVVPATETCSTAGDDDCDGETNEEGDDCACVPGSVVDCYSAPPITEGVGPCHGGTQTCDADGLGYGPCVGEVVPALETCDTPEDDDCDGETNEEGASCVCLPDSTADCYTGPAGTEGVGLCVTGIQTCDAQGLSYGPCVGDVVPAMETCSSPGDDDCDGETNEEGADCACAPGSSQACYSAQPDTENVGPCHGGMQTCDPDGLGFGPCVGEVVPASETCNTPEDDDCDGEINEEGAGCVCLPDSIAPCYTGPAGTEGVGLCAPGTQTCDAQGLAYGPCVGDVTPAAETCNTPGDDDCDGATNEEGAGCVCLPNSIAPCYTGPAGTNGVGLCAGGIQTCDAQGLSYGPCAGEVTPVPETCNTPGDDDCDGQTNEGGAGCVCLPNSMAPCYTGPAGTQDVGACTGGVNTCNNQGTAYGPCVGQVTPVPETCNTAVDDDCDGQANEGGVGCVCLPNSTAPCYTGPPGTEGIGMCAGGVKTCNSQGTAYDATCVGQVTPVAETCNTPGDDDCDGSTNESGAGCVCLPNSTAACYTGPAGTQGVGPCAGGTKTCNGQGTAYGSCVGEVLPAPETCNTPIDDNCNGQINEGGAGCVCAPNSVSSCYTGPAGTEGVGICSDGTHQCNAQGTAFGPCMGQVLPLAEACNSADDDCDGTINDGDPGGGAACTSGQPGICSPGVMHCVGTSLTCVPNATPMPEVCNGADDDCDGSIDDGNPGGGGVCMSGLPGRCAPGHLVCAGGALTCQQDLFPIAETCNMQDDDCDGATDNGFNTATDVNNCGTCGNVCNVPNATEACSGGMCSIASCAAGFANTDGSYANGCECMDTDSGDACGTVISSTLFSEGASGTFSGKIASVGDADWYEFVFTDNADAGNGVCDPFRPNITFLANPSALFQFEVFNSDCSARCGAPVVDFKYYSGNSADACCYNSANPGPGLLSCADQSQTVRVKVTRTNGTASCDTYSLLVKNGP